MFIAELNVFNYWYCVLYVKFKLAHVIWKSNQFAHACCHIVGKVCSICLATGYNGEKSLQKWKKHLLQNITKQTKHHGNSTVTHGYLSTFNFHCSYSSGQRKEEIELDTTCLCIMHIIAAFCIGMLMSIYLHMWQAHVDWCTVHWVL